MIIKNYEIKKIKVNNFKIFLLYGSNEGRQDEIIKNDLCEECEIIEKYDEKDILGNLDQFLSGIFNKSFFEDKKTVVISRVSDKILEFVNNILESSVNDIKIILRAGLLDKRSKLRNIFEKEKKLACIPFYQDEKKTLIDISLRFFKERKYSISQESINIIVERSNGDRKNLLNQINKITLYKEKGQKISSDEVLKLTNLSENYSFGELVDNCLSKNSFKTAKIINENNFSIDDSIFILRILLQRSKRVLNLIKSVSLSNNIDEEVLKYKPPIFWKEKETVKRQVMNWKQKEIEGFIFKINDLELMIKKNNINSLNILFDFLLSNSVNLNN